MGYQGSRWRLGGWVFVLLVVMDAHLAVALAVPVDVSIPPRVGAYCWGWSKFSYTTDRDGSCAFDSSQKVDASLLKHVADQCGEPYKNCRITGRDLEWSGQRLGFVYQANYRIAVTCDSEQGPVTLHPHWETRIRVVQCRRGYVENSTTGLCDPPADGTLEPDKNHSMCGVGANGSDPIQTATGDVLEQEEDYRGVGSLRFVRYYMSAGFASDSTMGSRWRHNFSYRLKYLVSAIKPLKTAVVLDRPHGNSYYFTQDAGGLWHSDIDVALTLHASTNAQGEIVAWTVHNLSGQTEHYNAKGQLVKIVWPGSYRLRFAYTGGRLTKVSDEHGRALHFNYTRIDRAPFMLLTQVTMPDGMRYTYDYNDSHVITKVTMHSKKAARGAQIHRRYSYESPYGKALLTEVIDASGHAIGSWSYNVFGQATINKRGPLDTSIGRTKILYNPGSSTVINAVDDNLWLRRTLYFRAQHGVAHLTRSTSRMVLPGKMALPATVTYDARGYPLTRRDFNGHLTSTRYSSQGLLLEKREAVGTPAQRTFSYVWDAALRQVLRHQIRDAKGHLVSFWGWAYNSRGQVTARCLIDPSQAADYTCRVDGTAPPGVRRWRYTYCDHVDTTACPIIGLRLAAIGPRTDVRQETHYRYYLSSDESGCGKIGGACHRTGDLYQIIDAMGHTVTALAYDKNGRLRRQRDANGVITDFAYAPRGGLTRRIVRASLNGRPSPADAIIKIKRDDAGKVTAITDADGVSHSYRYDSAYRVIEMQVNNGWGPRIHYRRNALGEMTDVTVYDKSSTVTQAWHVEYDRRGQLVRIRDGEKGILFDASAAHNYDPNGNLIDSVDARNTLTHRRRDARGRLIKTTHIPTGTDSGNSAIRSYTYDALGRVLSVTDADGLMTRYHYDGLGNLVGMHSPDRGDITQHFDRAGNLVQRTDARGITATYRYDALNRLTGVSYPDADQNIRYSYDNTPLQAECSHSYPVGRLTGIMEHGVTTAYCYDAQGHVTWKAQEQGSSTDSTAYVWSAAGRLGGIVYPDGHMVRYKYNNGRVLQVYFKPCEDKQANWLLDDVQYLPFGPIKHYTLGGSPHQTVTRDYDKNGYLTRITSAALNLELWHDARGHLTGVYEANLRRGQRRRDYGYDWRYRLTDVYALDGMHQGGRSMPRYEGYIQGRLGRDIKPLLSYTYSKAGDRLSKHRVGEDTVHYHYLPGSHRLIGIDDTSRKFDASGNTTALNYEGATYLLHYNARNRLASVKKEGHLVATYIYNAWGERIAKTVRQGGAQQTTRFSYDEQGYLLSEHAEDGRWRDYIWLDGMPVAVVTTARNKIQVRDIIADGSGTPRVLMDRYGKKRWRWLDAEDPFGTKAPESVDGKSTLNLRFPGQYFDQETGFYYNLHRDYEPGSGRYLQADPIGLKGGLNPYTYVHSAPLDNSDPSGLFQFGTRGLANPLYSFSRSSGESGIYLPKLKIRGNYHLRHEHGFYEDGTGDNIGYGDNGLFSEDESKAYDRFGPHYDDAIMRKSENNLRKSGDWTANKYHLFGHNCQDFADALRHEYCHMKREKPRPECN